MSVILSSTCKVSYTLLGIPLHRNPLSGMSWEEYEAFRHLYNIFAFENMLVYPLSLMPFVSVQTRMRGNNQNQIVSMRGYWM